MTISKNLLSVVRAVSIIEIISHYIDLKRCGSQYKGLCPFHEEHNPSFYVHPTKGYKCFGCEAKGSSAVSFIMAYEGKSYPEAIIHIAGMVGMPTEKDEKESLIPFSVAKNLQKLTKVNPQSDSFIQSELCQATLKNYEENCFVQFLIRVFGNEIANELISKYYIGTSKYWPGATIFWQVDSSIKIRTGKIMLYDASNGKRVKKPYDHINWVHTVLKLPEFSLRQCSFGEHLLIGNMKNVAFAESEKTAIIASVYLPQFIWLATGGLNGLTSEKSQILKGRNVTLFPDLGSYKDWSKKAKELSHIANFTVSDLLERKANAAEKKQKLDIADYLIKYNYIDFLKLNNW